MKCLSILLTLTFLVSCASTRKVPQADDIKPYLTMLKNDETLSPSEKEKLEEYLDTLPITITDYRVTAQAKAYCWMSNDLEERRLEFVKNSFHYPKTVELYTVKRVKRLPKVLDGTSLRVKRKYLLVKRSVLDCLNENLRKRNGVPFITINRYLGPSNNKPRNIIRNWQTLPSRMFPSYD